MLLYCREAKLGGQLLDVLQRVAALLDCRKAKLGGLVRDVLQRVAVLLDCRKAKLADLRRSHPGQFGQRVGAVVGSGS